MMNEDTLPLALARAMRRLLAPLFRVLLRHGMSYTAFEALARRVYVQVAIDEFGLPGKKPSISRTSILSGLTRKDVQRLLAEALEATEPASEHVNRAARVLAAWTRDPDFLDAGGQPRTLALQDGPGSFAKLVRRHSGDMPVRAVLDELEHAGAARRRPDGQVELVARVFLPRRSAVDKIDLLGDDVADLIGTIDHNILHGSTDPRFHRKVMYRDMPVEVAAPFRELGRERAMALLVELDQWLAARAAAASDTAAAGPTPSAPTGPLLRLGLGIYYFEEPLEPSPQPSRKED